MTAIAPRFFETGAAFRAWLESHHERKTELLVGFYKKGSKRGGVTYGEALDEALAFGWIDGVRRSRDAESYTIRFSPRKRGSIWSNINIRHVKRLVAEGRMQAAGLRAYEARTAKRSGIYSFERQPMAFDAAAEQAFAANRKAKTFFDAQPPGYKRVTTFWVMNAKKADTRARRLAHVIDKSARGERIDMMKPFA
jgi:uncharacterized protein YdeI (YjbR/CyaY-like superfamily)